MQDRHEIVRVLIGQWPEQHGIHHAECRRGRADAEAERENDRQTDTGRAGGHANAEANVLPQPIDERAWVRVAHLFLDRFDAAERRKGRAPGVVRLHAGGGLFVRQQFRVTAQLGVDVAVVTPAPAQPVPQ